MKQNAKQKMKNDVSISMNGATMNSQASAKSLPANFKLERSYIYGS